MPYDVLDVANEFLELSKNEGEAIDPLKLQKLVYLAHGWNLALTGTPLIENVVEAWKWGPVVPKLYREFRHFKSNPITGKSDRIISAGVDEEAAKMIKSVWKAYKKYSPIELSMLTHEHGSAWDIVRRNSEEWESPVISNALIRDEFLRRKEHRGRLE